MKTLVRLKDKIKYIKKVFKTPYHFFYVGQKGKLVGIRFEDKNGKNYSFTGYSMMDSVKSAEKYVRDEISAGSLKEIEVKKEEEKKEEVKKEEGK